MLNDIDAAIYSSAISCETWGLASGSAEAIAGTSWRTTELVFNPDGILANNPPYFQSCPPYRSIEVLECIGRVTDDDAVDGAHVLSGVKAYNLKSLSVVGRAAISAT